ncbi:MAG: glycerol-3-phosphate 1-O-acyltransferase PlsY [Vicinamibacterales bacterium]
MTESIVAVLMGYGIGSLPVGYVVTNAWRGIDLRRVGSGNVGAANVYRTAGLAMALVVMLLDLGKGVGTVAAARAVGSGVVPVAAGVAAVLGHVYPVWLRFRGGKGVATAAGVFSVLAPMATLCAAATFVTTVWVTRYVSLGSIVATAALPPLAWVTDAPLPVVAASCLTAALIIQRHSANLARLQAGTERRLGQRA